MRLSEALELIQRGEIPDGKTALGIALRGGVQDRLSSSAAAVASDRRPHSRGTGDNRNASIECQKWTLTGGILT